MPRRSTLLLLALFGLAGCIAAPTRTALNPLTGEQRDFPAEDEIPRGWIVCADASRCPAPRDCGTLDEASCLSRPDCNPTYSSAAAAPRECETLEPRPAVCDEDVFSGCTQAAAGCMPTDCGLAPRGATYLCDDGSAGGATGRCVLAEDGSCGWELRACPAPQPDQCPPADCGPAPDAPTEVCADGSRGGNTGVCLREADGCRWQMRACPASECTPDVCGPPPLSPAFLCADGSLGGNVGRCEPDASGRCGWVWRACPDVDVACDESECGPPSRAPLFECADGSLGGNIGVCDRNPDGVCAWVHRECPAAACSGPACELACPMGFAPPLDRDGCTNRCACEPLPCAPVDCGPMPPVERCSDGSEGGPTGACERTPDGTCAWTVQPCPPETCAVEDCGAPLRAPAFECADGSLGGNTGRCLQTERDGCEWEQRACPDVCADVPQCRLLCPAGFHHRRDEDGCLRTCECEAD